MSEWRWTLGAFGVGYLLNEIVRFVQFRTVGWRIGREFRRAEQRMKECPHLETSGILIPGLDGSEGVVVDQCLVCWALNIDGQWRASTVSPERQANV